MRQKPSRVKTESSRRPPRVVDLFRPIWLCGGSDKTHRVQIPRDASRKGRANGPRVSDDLEARPLRLEGATQRRRSVLGGSMPRLGATCGSWRRNRGRLRLWSSANKLFPFFSIYGTHCSGRSSILNIVAARDGIRWTRIRGSVKKRLNDVKPCTNQLEAFDSRR